MNVVRNSLLSVLLLAQLTATPVRASAPLLEYMKVGLGAATLAVCAWSVVRFANLLADFRDLAELYYLEGQEDRFAARMLNEQYSVYMYLQSLQNRIQTARMLQNETPEFLIAAGLTEEELAWALEIESLFIESDPDEGDVYYYCCSDECNGDDDDEGYDTYVIYETDCN